MADTLERGEAKLIADYADLGISCGYVGNIEGGRDDRSFRVFTKLARKRDALRPDVCVYVFDIPPGFKGAWPHEIVFDTEATRVALDDLRARLKAGRLFMVGA